MTRPRTPTLNARLLWAAVYGAIALALMVTFQPGPAGPLTILTGGTAAVVAVWHLCMWADGKPL